MRLALASIPCFLSAAADAGDDWPQFLGPTRNGVYAGVPLGSWKEGGPPVLWRKGIGRGFSGPVVAEGRLILFHRLGDRETVECLEAGSGKQIWTIDYPTGYEDDFGFDDGPRATPAVSEGRVYTFGAEGALHCLDLSSGAKLWSVDTQEKFRARKGFFGLASSPLIEGDRVLLIIGGKNKNSGLVAFQKRDGQVLWTATDDQASYSSPVAATIGGRRHAFFFTRSGLTDLDPQTGEVRFQFPWGTPRAASVNAATPLVIDDLVFLSASYQVGAVVLKIKDNGVDEVWKSDDVLSNHYATGIHREGYLYGFDGRQEASPHLRCVELKTGKIRWTEDRFGAGTITLAADRLLILSEGGELVMAPAVPDAFRPLARARVLKGTVRAYPALAGARLYARNEDTLVCVDLR